MKKRILSIITIMLALTLCVCAIGFSAGAEESATPSVSIDKFNLVFDDNVYLKYAVKFDGIDDSAINSSNIGMLYFTTPQSEYIEGNESFSSGVVGFTTISDQKYYTFEYRHITAKQMTDYIYSVAYIDVDGVRYYSSPAKYSVLEYAYSKLGKTGEASTSETFKAMLESMLEYGANAQKHFNHNTERLANEDYYLIEVIGGTLEDGFTKGLYHNGETATLTAPETSGELVFAGWENDDGEIISSDNPAAIDEFSKNASYTAIYQEDVKYSKGLEYTANSDGTCSVTGMGTCTDTEVIIPSIAPTGDVVTSIGYKAFANQSSIISVIIPDGVTQIGSKAFYECDNLAKITLGTGLTSIGNNAFGCCPCLKGVYISDIAAWCNISFTEYNQNPVFFAKNLYLNGELIKELIIPDGVTAIPNHAFEYQSSITNVTIPDSVTAIGNYAFYECSSINSVTIGNNVTRIGDSAFSCCDNLSNIAIPNSVTTIGSEAFYGCAFTNIVIGNGITSIGYRAFYYCNRLSNLYYTGTDVEWNNISIDNDNRELTNATHYYYSKTVPTIEGNFWHYVDGEPAPWPEYAAPIYSQGLEYTSNGNGTCFISGMGSCVDSNVIIPSTSPTGDIVVAIGYKAFSSQRNIKSVIIPEGVTSISSYAFSRCSSLEIVTIPRGVVEMLDYSFSYCSSLTTITIPDGVTKIGAFAFEACSSLESITIPDSVTYLGNCAFHSCSNLKNFSLGNSVTSIKKDTFALCSSLTNIIIPDNVTSIGDGAFWYCSALESVTIGNGVTSIGDAAFWYCSSLTSITLGNSVTTIIDYAFCECSSLKNIILPDSVTSIGAFAFVDCYALEEITIGKGLTTIGECAFYACYAIADVYYAGTETDWAAISIGRNNEALTQETIYYDYRNVDLGYSKGLKYISMDDGTCYVGGLGRCKDVDIIIPSVSPTNELVIGIWTNAFRAESNIKSIVIPRSVKTIGQTSFYGCSSLESITFSDSITSIGYNAFYGCSSLKSITFLDGVTYIDFDVFSKFPSLNSIMVPNSLESCYINYASLSYALPNLQFNEDEYGYYLGNSDNPYVIFLCGKRLDSVTEFVVHDGTKIIADWALHGSLNSSYNSVVIPKSVTYIGTYAFTQRSIDSIYYNGTKNDFRSIKLSNMYNQGIYECTLYCTDGSMDVSNHELDA